MKKQYPLLILCAALALPALSTKAHARADVDVEDNELGPAEGHYQKAKQDFYARVNEKLHSGDEYDRRRAKMLLSEMPDIISKNEALSAKKCDTVSRLIGNGKQSNIADFHCQMDEMKKMEIYLSKVLTTFSDLEYPGDQTSNSGTAE